jgi:hypothetical protein
MKVSGLTIAILMLLSSRLFGAAAPSSPLGHVAEIKTEAVLKVKR